MKSLSILLTPLRVLAPHFHMHANLVTSWAINFRVCVLHSESKNFSGSPVKTFLAIIYLPCIIYCFSYFIDKFLFFLRLLNYIFVKFCNSSSYRALKIFATPS